LFWSPPIATGFVFVSKPYENITVRVNQAFIDPTQKFFDTKYNEYLRERDKAVTIPTRTD
jgi:hypothetical protein